MYVKRDEFVDFTKTETEFSLTFPVIIKPLDDGHGNGVQVNITSIEELIQKLEKALPKYGTMIVQEQASGDESRVVVLEDEVLVAFIRVPPSVIGDGKSTIIELVEAENTHNTLRDK